MLDFKQKNVNILVTLFLELFILLKVKTSVSAWDIDL